MILNRVGLPMSKNITLNSCDIIHRNLSNYLMFFNLEFHSDKHNFMLNYIFGVWKVSELKGSMYPAIDKGRSKLFYYFKTQID